MIDKFTVKRDEWLRGTTCGYFFNKSEGCCVWGHYLVTAGLEKEYLTSMQTIEDLDIKHKDLLPEWSFSTSNFNWLFSSQDFFDIIDINDDNESSDEDKEKLLVGLFEKRNIELKFEN